MIDKEYEIDQYILNSLGNEIIIYYNIKLTSNCTFTICDYKQNKHKYTIIANNTESRDKANIIIHKNTQTMLEGINHIYFSSYDYDVNQITEIVLKKYNLNYEHIKDIMYYKHNYIKINEETLFIENSIDSTIRISMNVDSKDKYSTIYQLYSIKDIKNNKRIFTNECVLKDLIIKKSVFELSEISTN